MHGFTIKTVTGHCLLDFVLVNMNKLFENL